MAEFRIECFQNEFLPLGGQVMNAVLTVTATGTGAATASSSTRPERSELLIVDTSGSMSGKRLREAKVATAAAIDCIPDGVRFGVITGNHEAELAFPEWPPLAVSSEDTRAAAKATVKEFEAGGGTAMGRWIRLAAATFGEATGIRHAILLTDGKNENEEVEVLDQTLSEVEGSFQCDCRGVGANWEVAELRKVATALVGTIDIVADPDGLKDDFSLMMKDALNKHVGEVYLRIWTPQGAHVTCLRHLDSNLDLTALRADTGPLVGEYPTGSWGDETRDYFLSVQVPSRQVGAEGLAARVTVVINGQAAEESLVRATWTDDTARSTQLNRRVAQAMDQEELAEVIQDVVDAFNHGEIDSATAKAGKAVRLAHEAGNEDVIGRLSKLVDIDDRATGRVRAKKKVEALDVMILDTRSVTSRRIEATEQGDTGRGEEGA
ncbi:MAG TPA: VWA domain-containing protein [Acidimicrobiales bacterium]